MAGGTISGGRARGTVVMRRTWAGLMAAPLIMCGAAAAQPSVVLPAPTAPDLPPGVAPRSHELLAVPGAEDWPRPELVRSLTLCDHLLPWRERESLWRAHNLMVAGEAEAGEALLRALGEHAAQPELRARAWFELAAALADADRDSAALAAIDRALAARDWGTQTWRWRAWRAWLLVNMGQIESGARELVAAAGLAPAGLRMRADLLHWAGWLHADRGDFDAARQAWRQALQDASAHLTLADTLHLALAQTLVVEGRWSEALPDLRVVAAQPQAPPLSRFLLGRALYESGRGDSAEVVLGSLLKEHPDAPVEWLNEARVLLGSQALARGETQRALDLYGAVSGQQLEDQLPSRYGTALALVAEGRSAQAESLLAPGAPVDRQHPLYYPWVYALAYARFQLERYPAAIATLDEFHGRAEADSLSGGAWSLRGDCLYRLGQTEEALAAYSQASSFYVDIPEVLLRRQALAVLSLQDWGAATRLLGELIVRFPGTSHGAEYNFWRAEAYYQLGRRDDARRHYRRALALGADPAACTYALGWCDYEEHRYAQALVHFDRALALCRGCPFAADLLLRRGNCLFNLGRIEEAERSFAQAASQARGGSLAGLGGEATFQRGWALLRLEDFAEARAAFARIRAEQGDTAMGAEALYWEAVAFFRQELYDQAAERFRAVQSMRGVPDSLRVRAQLGLGDCHFNSGDFRGAVEWYRSILAAPGAADPLVQTAHESVFECRVALNEWDLADSALATLAARFPHAQGLVDRYLQVAEGYFREKRYRSAIDAFGSFLERAPTQDPRLLNVRFQIARSREALGEREVAAAAYEALGEREDFRDRSEALLRAGMLRLDGGQPREALRPLEKRLALELDPAQTALTRAYLADGYQKLGERQAARGEWEKVAAPGGGASDSLRAVANLRLGRMAFEQREWQGAFLHFAAADSLGAAAAVYRPRYWAGEAALRGADTTRAIRWLEAFLAQPEEETLWEATARLRLGACYVGRGRMRDAREQYETVLRLPLREEALLDEARQRLRQLGDHPRNRER